MSQSLKEKLSSYGQWTYRAAWALEITAATLGLATGIALGYQGFNAAEGDSVTSTDLILASAPFFMVAIAELTKIPIATLLFSVSWFWKPIVAVFLIALAGITFETVFMGLERAVTLRQLRYETIVKKIDGLSFERDQLASRLADAEANNSLTKAQADFDRLSIQSETERTKILDLIAETDKEFEGQRFLTPEAARLRDRINDRSAERDRLTSERDARLKDAISQFEGQRNSFVDRIKAALSTGNSDLASRTQTQLAALTNPRPRIEKEYAGRIEPLETEIAQLRQDFDEKLAAAAPLSEPQKQAIELRRDSLKQRLISFDAATANQKLEAQKRINEAQERERNKADVVSADQKRKDDIALKLSEDETKRIELARTDQVRRIAARFYGSKPEDVTDDQAGFVSVIWFGSLALLAALAGPITAIVALALQRIPAFEEKRRESNLARLLRLILLSWRWKRTRSVKVNVEVPVERVIKEILYVPILTDDPDAVRRAIAETLPKDIADLVSVSLAGVKNADAPQHSPA